MKLRCYTYNKLLSVTKAQIIHSDTDFRLGGLKQSCKNMNNMNIKKNRIPVEIRQLKKSEKEHGLLLASVRIRHRKRKWKKLIFVTVETYFFKYINSL